MRTKDGIRYSFDEIILTLESVENAVMRIKLALRDNEIETARDWHGRLESYVQSLYNSGLHDTGTEEVGGLAAGREARDRKRKGW